MRSSLAVALDRCVPASHPPRGRSTPVSVKPIEAARRRSTGHPGLSRRDGERRLRAGAALSVVTSSRRSPLRALNDRGDGDAFAAVGGSSPSAPLSSPSLFPSSSSSSSYSSIDDGDDFPSPSRSFVDVDPALDAEIEALAEARDAAAAAAAAQAAYVRAVTARDAPPSVSDDEAETLYNASPYVNVKCEYGYIQSNAGLYIDISKSRPPGVPKNILAISAENFKREWAALRAAMRGEDDMEGNGGGDMLAVPAPVDATDATGTRRDAAAFTEEEVELMSELRDRLAELELSNDAIWARERARPEVPAPWIIKVPYYVLCYFLDAVFPENRPVQRFWFLETVARMPYFSYNTMLTLYELLGWWWGPTARPIPNGRARTASSIRAPTLYNTSAYDIDPLFSFVCCVCVQSLTTKEAR